MTRRARKLGVAAIGTLLAGGALTMLSLAQSPAPQRIAPAPPASADHGPSFAIRARLVYPLTAEQPGPIERGTIIVRNGRIEAVGCNLELPSDLPLIDLRDEIVCPGFVSAGSALTAQHAGPHSVSGAYHAIDAFDTYGDYAATLARGTTTAHVNPGFHRLVSGVGGVVKLAGPPNERTLTATADLTMTLGVFNPPVVVDMPFYASSDVPIEPAERQRPDSRLGQYLELDEQIAAATRWLSNPEAYRDEKFDLHARAFATAWAAKLPMRVEVRRAADIEGALQFVGRYERSAYLVGLTEGDRLADALCEAHVPVVIRVEQDYRHPTADIGPAPDALEPRISTAGMIAGGPQPRIALAGGQRDMNEDLRMAAILAVRGGMPPEQALAAITRVPAEILGVGNRVGSLAPGMDADLLVLTGEPLDINSYVQQVYVAGETVFEAPHPEALVVRAGRVWVGDGTVLNDGSVLIEDGKIQAVGQRVPHPPFARIIDAGADSFLTPGFIDAHGHLGLEGDRTVAKPDLQPHQAIAVADREFARVARAGVTTVMLAPYRDAPNGARMAAIKTYGTSRSELVASELSGLRFSLRGKDPFTAGIEPLRKALEAGKKYYDSWKKYEEELAKWQEARDKGEVEKKKEEETESVVKDGKPDPITGTWEFAVSGGPLPEPVTGTMTLKLTGNSIEGRLTDPESGEEATLTGTLNGDQVRLEIEAEDSPVGNPVIEATLDAEDHMTGKVTVTGFEADFEATRTDKSAVEFKVTRKRKRYKDGRPVPPKIDENLEPFRPLLDSKIPAVVQVETAAQIDAALKLFIEEYKVPLVLVGAEDAADVTERIAQHKDKLGVVVPPDIVRTRQRQPYTQAADLSRKGIPVALQSDSEDGARSLPLMGLFAVRNGLGGDAALRALTVDAARMYKLDDRVGSLEPGKDADLLIFSGYPFDADSRLERVIVSGHEVPDEP